MAILKLNNEQYWKVRNSALHYNLDYRYIDKDKTWEVECDGPTSIEIKKLVDN
jgi:hypothetical protein